MKTLMTFVIGIAICSARAGSFERKLAAFDKIVVSPKINLVIRTGTEEKLLVNYDHVQESQINAEVINGKLHLYLDHARFVEKKAGGADDRDWDRSMYSDAVITAYVTCRELAGLEVRGDQLIEMEGKISSRQFILKSYGETEIRIDTLVAEELNVKMYGTNRMRILAGHIESQKYKLFGDNKIDTRLVDSQIISTTIYGDGILRVNASEEMQLSAFGEPSIELSGNARFYKGIVVGNPRIYDR